MGGQDRRGVVLNKGVVILTFEDTVDTVINGVDSQILDLQVDFSFREITPESELSYTYELVISDDNGMDRGDKVEPEYNQ